MHPIEIQETHVGPSLLRRLAAAWPKRATIRTDMAGVVNPGEYDPSLLDYPLHLIPFSQHPRFLEASEEQRMLVNTLAWIAYNERVIAAEENVANPTFEKLAHGVFPGVDRYEVKEVVQQSYIDEVWHTYMHMMAMQRTREAREIDIDTSFVQPVTNRRLYALAETMPEQWQKDLLYLMWTTVGEVSINAFLDLMAGDESIQPMHALIARLHARDEAAHGPVLAELMKEIYPKLEREQQEFFIRYLPEAIIAFGAEDYELWPEVLRLAGIEHIDEIIADSRSQEDGEVMMNDFGTVRRLLRDLGIEDEVKYDFVTAKAGAK
jgi:4-aminobenzoate N-oxygenase